MATVARLNMEQGPEEPDQTQATLHPPSLQRGQLRVSSWHHSGTEQLSESGQYFEQVWEERLQNLPSNNSDELSGVMRVP